MNGRKDTNKRLNTSVMGISSEKLHQIKKVCLESADIYLPSFDVERIDAYYRDTFLLMKNNDKRCPRILRIRDPHGTDSVDVIPYYWIKERPEAQIASFHIGRGLCNLAEIQEFFGTLYSRLCTSHDPCELPQQDPVQSQIALWAHDCLTQDFDHHQKLNRQVLTGGAAISFDYGMAFLPNYFPPFYTFELGIKDHFISENKVFLTTLLTHYALQTQISEEIFIKQIADKYPKTARPDVCRYYFRNYKSFFAKRLYFGRFFEKMKSSPFVREDWSVLLEIIGFPKNEITGWKSFLGKLSEVRFRQLDLQGLDLSGADLRKADLKRANLRNTNLQGANLERADLRGADMKGANVKEAKLKGALMS